ncbi:unnamed protein product [Mytilus coruscus]|uniref:Integrase p58-like C-terminal domain-containing protein n=1 Tax=Mytilus coruscus TaxID=42192 RepID=A0A6J8D651_MYTCO|nr:unnamed protein product [Mytilus coruscus]
MPNILTKADLRVPIVLNNLTDKTISLKKNRVIGTAMEICEVIDENRSVSEQVGDLDEINLDSCVNCNWISESEITNMGAEQRKDQELNRLIIWLEDKKEPEEHELYLCSPSIKHLWNCREVLHPINLLTGTCFVNFEAKETAHHVIDLKNTLQEAHKLAREKLQAAQLRQKRIYDIKLFHKTYEVGDMVFKLDSTSKVGQSKKLRAPWQGPYVVIRVLSPVLYEITGRKKEMIIHHDRIKQCDDEIVPLWIKRLRNRLFGQCAPEGNIDSRKEENELPDGWSDVLFSLPYSNCDSSAVQLNRNGESSVNRDSRPVGLDLDSENDINHGSCADPLDLAKMSNSDSSAVLLSPDKNTLKVPDKTESSGREKRKRVLPSYLSDYVVDVVSEET